MKMYSDFPVARSGQIIADLASVAAIVLFVSLGVATHALVVTFADLGRQLEGAGSGFQQTMTDAADRLGDVPLIGSGIRGPFDSASDAGGLLQEAGRSQQAAVEQAAVLIGLTVALVPIALLVRYWLLRRIAFARRASEAAALSRIPGGVDLLALRALATRTPTALLRVADDPAGAWRAGDEPALQALAALALRDAGVRQG